MRDVNEAAGAAAQIKLQKLEDAASALGQAEARIGVLNALRRFLLEDKQTTYFGIDFRNKEVHQMEYEIVQSLMDLRLLHLINAGLSDERQGARRSEVYMFDLSQFSGTRVKRNLKVLDLMKEHFVLKSTGESEPPKLGHAEKTSRHFAQSAAYDLAELSSLNYMPQSS